MANRETSKVPKQLALRGFTFQVHDRTELFERINAELNLMRMVLTGVNDKTNPADLEPMCWNVLNVMQMVGALEEWVEEVVK